MKRIPMLKLCTCKKHACIRLSSGEVGREFCSWHGALDEINRLVGLGKMREVEADSVKAQVPGTWPLSDNDANSEILMKCVIWNDPEEEAPRVPEPRSQDACVSPMVN